MKVVQVMAKWLELTADYKCNNRCLGCFAVNDEAQGMDAKEIVQTLAYGRSTGATSLWLGGGEPTLRKDLFAIVKEAKRQGYQQIKLETNGMMLAYQTFTEKCKSAGVTEVSFSIKGADEQTHDRLTQTPGCFSLLIKAIEQVRNAGLTMEGDILVYRSNTAQIPEIVRFYSSLGITYFRVWLLSSVDQLNQTVIDELPKISEVVPYLVQALSVGTEITSLHTPPCTIPDEARKLLFFAPDLSLLVANPGGYKFMLEQSPIEGGYYLPGCDGCAMRSRCGGLRKDYVTRFGEQEFVPVQTVMSAV